MLNLFELKKMASAKHEPLFGDAQKLAQYDFMQEYLEDFDSFDEDFVEEKGFMYPLWNMEEAEGNDDAVLEHFRGRAFQKIKRNSENLRHIWEIRQQHYNPIENYSMVEEGELKRTGADTNTTVFGQQRQDMHIDMQHLESVKGEQNDEENIGARSTEQTGEVSAYNQTLFSPSDKQSMSEQAHLDTRTSGQRIDEQTSDPRDDFTTTQEHTDQTTLEKNTKDENKLTRKGNIGVTTTQQMLEQENVFWTNYDFYKRLYSVVTDGTVTFFDRGVVIPF